MSSFRRAKFQSTRIPLLFVVLLFTFIIMIVIGEFAYSWRGRLANLKKITFLPPRNIRHFRSRALFAQSDVWKIYLPASHDCAPPFVDFFNSSIDYANVSVS